MIKTLIAFMAISISLGANAAVIHPEWKFSEDGLLQGKAEATREWQAVIFARFMADPVGALPFTEPARGVFSPCYLDKGDWCNQHSRKHFSPVKNHMAYSYEFNHYTIANWPIKNHPIPVAEPVTVLLFFIGFVLVFFRNLRIRMKQRYVHNFPVLI